MNRFLALLMVLGMVSIGQAVILDFEDGISEWSTADGANTIEQSTTGVTSGSYSMKYTLSANSYWGFQWNAPAVPDEFGMVKFDITRFAEDWPADHWTNVGDKIALSSDGPDGWKEYSIQAVIDKNTGEPVDGSAWGAWNGDTVWTLVYDCSDYNATGATWFQLIMSTNSATPATPGILYVDNVQFPVPAPREPMPSNGGLGGLLTDLTWTNALEDLDNISVWFGDPNDLITEDNYKTYLSEIYSEAAPGATSTCPNANLGTLTDGKEYLWCVESFDPNVPIVFWTFTATPNEAPTADAGADQDLYGSVPYVATLDGSASSDDGLIAPLTYSWVQTAGPEVVIDTPDAAVTTVTLPEIANSVEYWNEPAEAYYEFELTVDDGQATDTATVMVTLSTDSCVASVEAGGFYYYGDIAGPDGAGDEFRDCKIDLYDFAELMLNWLSCSDTFELCQ